MVKTKGVLMLMAILIALGSSIALLTNIILEDLNSSVSSYKAFTVLVYNGTHIQDYFVECVNGIEVNRTPVSDFGWGEPIYVGEDWKDWRTIIPSC